MYLAEAGKSYEIYLDEKQEPLSNPSVKNWMQLHKFMQGILKKWPYFLNVFSNCSDLSASVTIRKIPIKKKKEASW